MTFNMIKMSCCAEAEESTCPGEQVPCPICKGKTQVVKTITVQHLVIDSLVDKVIDNRDYRICLNEMCDVVYFDLHEHDILRIPEIKVPVWFKKGANPKFICYCNHITEQQIITVVLDHGAKDFKDIVRLTGGMKKCNCKVNNPLGKCCSPAIQETIQKALDIGKNR